MKVATYSRVSTVHHGQNTDVQSYELKRYCAARGWDVLEEIFDQGFSGGTDQRPGLKKLLALARSRQIDGIVVLKLDRLFRSLKHLVTALEEFQALGITFVATKDNVDYSTPAGRLFIQVLGSLAEFEKSLIRERTLMGLAHAKAKGKRLGRPRKHSIIELRRLRTSGLSYRQIASRTGASMGSITSAIRNCTENPISQVIKNPTNSKSKNE